MQLGFVEDIFLEHRFILIKKIIPKTDVYNSIINSKENTNKNVKPAKIPIFHHRHPYFRINQVIFLPKTVLA